jgi:uncharacterized membrane protein YgcG
MNTSFTLWPRGRHAHALFAIMMLFGAASNAQTTSTAFPIPLIANGTNIGSINCVYDSPYTLTGTCNVNVTASTWCVANFTTSAVLAAAPNSSSGSTPPANCVKTLALPLTTAACNAAKQPYNVTLTGVAFNSGPSPKPVCKGPHVHHKAGDDLSHCNEHHHHDDDCEESGSVHSRHSHQDLKTYFSTTGKLFSGTVTSKDGICAGHNESESEHHHHTGGGSGGSGGSTGGATYNLKLNGLLPCHTPTPL